MAVNLRAAAAVDVSTGPDPGFQVHLEVFDGPFEVLLRLIAKHQLDVTRVALSQVTDDFLAFLAAAGGQTLDLEQATAFLVVAAVLLDLKTARLLPTDTPGEADADIAALEERDLLFARLLQYRAYREVARIFADWVDAQAAKHAGGAAPGPGALPGPRPVRLGISLPAFARLAAEALSPRSVPVVPLDHVHVPRVSVREQATRLAEQLALLGQASFRALCSDCVQLIELVARFLAVLELYRDGTLDVQQDGPTGELLLRWLPAQSTPPGEGAPGLPKPEPGVRPAIGAGGGGPAGSDA